MKQHYSSKEMREAMKEDELEGLLTRTSGTLRRYRQALLLAVFAVVAAGAVYLMYTNFQTGKREEAADAYNKAMQVLSQNNWQEAAAQFDAVARDFAGTATALRATVAAAQAYFSQGDYAKARERFQQLADHSDPTLASDGLTGVGMALEAEEKSAEAVQHYQKALEQHPTWPLAEVWRYRMAYCLERQGETDKAIATYQAIDKKSGMREEAEQRLLWLKTQPVIAQM